MKRYAEAEMGIAFKFPAIRTSTSVRNGAVQFTRGNRSGRKSREISAARGEK